MSILHLMQEREESNMPKGKENKYFDGGIATNDARNRNVNTMGDGFNSKPQPKPIMPSEPPNQTENYDLYDQWVEKYNEDIQLGKDGGKIEKYKAGGKVKKTKEEMDAETDAKRTEQKRLEHKEATKDKITKYKHGKDVTRRDDEPLYPPQIRAMLKELEAHLKGELKNKPYKRKYTEEEKSKPKFMGKEYETKKYKKGGLVEKKKTALKELGSALRKASIYLADPKEKEPHGGVVKGGKSQKAKHRKIDLAETKAKNKKRVRKVEKWETGQGSTYKGGKGFKAKKKTRTYKRDEYGNIVKGK